MSSPVVTKNVAEASKLSSISSTHGRTCVSVTVSMSILMQTLVLVILIDQAAEIIGKNRYKHYVVNAMEYYRSGQSSGFTI